MTANELATEIAGLRLAQAIELAQLLVDSGYLRLAHASTGIITRAA